MSGVLAWLLRFLSGGILDRVLANLGAAMEGANARQRIEAEIAIEHVRAELGRRQAQRDVLIAEQGRLITALMRPLFAYPLAAYYGAVILDSLFHFRWNVAALPAPAIGRAGSSRRSSCRRAASASPGPLPSAGGIRRIAPPRPKRGGPQRHSAPIHIDCLIETGMVRHAFLATLLGAALFLAGPTGSGPETARAQGCLSQGDTRAAVASGEAASLSRFVGDLRQLGQVVSSRLCSRNGRLVYEVSVVSGNGNVQTVLLDARSGARLN